MNAPRTSASPPPPAQGWSLPRVLQFLSSSPYFVAGAPVYPTTQDDGADVVSLRPGGGAGHRELRPQHEHADLLSCVALEPKQPGP